MQRSAWVVAFIAAVMAGEEILVLTVKQLADRVTAGVQSRRRDARAVIPERSLGDCSCVLRDGCIADRPPASRARSELR